MTAPPLDTPSTKSNSSRSFTAPLLLWLLIQCLAVLLAASRMPLSARFEQPGERLAVHEMIIVQIVAAAMLFPILLRDWRSTLAIFLTSWPFTQLAAFLAPVESAKWIAAASSVSVWIITLACWRYILRRSSAQLIGVAVACAVAIGGPALWYLRGEFSKPEQTLDWSRDAVFGPVMAALAQLDTPLAFRSWVAPLAMLFFTLAACGITIARRRKH